MRACPPEGVAFLNIYGLASNTRERVARASKFVDTRRRPPERLVVKIMKKAWKIALPLGC